MHVRLTTYPWAILFLLVVAAFSTSATAAPPPTQVPDEFVLYKERGDHGRVTGRLSEAQENYEKALALRVDPVVTGRLGLVLLARRDFEGAAAVLHRAVNDTSTSLSTDERVKFSRAYSDALREVCRVNIKVDHADEQLEIMIDDVTSRKGRAAYWLFLKPGTHVIRAKLEGFEDAVETIVTERNCPHDVNVELHLEPISRAPGVVTIALAEQSKTLVEKSHAFVAQSKTSVDAWTLYTAKPLPNPLKTSMREGFVLGVGAWIPFGITPGVGIGGQLHGGWRSRSWWEIGVDGRIAAALGGDELSAKSAYTWSLGLTPCGHYGAHVFGCVLVQLDGGASRNAGSWALPAFGARGGYAFHLNERFDVRVFGDFGVHLERPESYRDNTLIWAGKTVALALGATINFFLDRP